MEKIQLKNAYEHNLKHLDLEIPLNTFTCVTGCSGCGKSSLVFDTIYAESQRGLLEGITGNIYGQKLMNKPKVDSIDNLRPAVNISQNYYNVNPRSTIGTTTEISYSLRSIFALMNSEKEMVSENIFSANNPKSCCPHCMCLGVENRVSKELLIPDKNKTLREGAILFFKGAPESKEQKYLDALCEQYGIDPNKKVNELSKEELHDLLYADDKIRYMLSYKEGKRRKKHYVTLQGAITAIETQRSIGGQHSESSGAYASYIEDVPCHVCGGAKLNQNVLKYKVDGLNYSEVGRMELTALASWLDRLVQGNIPVDRKHDILGLVKNIQRKLDALIQLNVGYLSLERSIPSLSGGERQRVRIATRLTCSLKGLIYILDEPCKGLHYRDVTNIINATHNLIKNDNTVIAIEHNKRYISAAEHIIELGPVGGPNGGYILYEGNESPYIEGASQFKETFFFEHFVEIEKIYLHNIKDENVKFPIGGITCITGVSGSGKSTLAEIIYNCLKGRSSGYCSKITGDSFIKRVIKVDQSPIGKTPRSTLVSYLGIYDEIRSLYSKTDKAKKLKLKSSSFSMNLKGGRCECCQGTGMKKIELNYMPSTYITCPECEGRRFNDQVLSVTYKQRNILDILETPIEDIIDTFYDSKKVYSVLQSMIDMGLGYLKLGQMSMNLSGGEAQRIKLAKALGTPSHGHNLYILDEPTSGLNDADTTKFMNILLSLQKKQDTLLIIEHNIEFIVKVADYIIDFGLLGGQAGGKIVAQGIPKNVFSDLSSSLYGLDNLQNIKEEQNNGE